MTHCSKKGGHIFVHHPARNVCAKFQVNRLSDLRTGARQVFTTQKPFAREI